MTVYICNAFSLSMYDRELQRTAAARKAPRPVENPRAYLDEVVQEQLELGSPITITSVVGHVDVAEIFSAIFSRRIPVNRITVKLEQGDIALVGQYVGPRLPEGATKLPEGARIEWWIV